MKRLNNVMITVFETEKINETRQALIDLVKLDLEKEKLKINEYSAEGFENKINILEIRLEKERHTNYFIQRLQELFNKEQKELLIKQIESRLDEDLFFFIRLDKSKWLNKEIWITDSGDCFHIKMSVVCFPKTRELAKAAIKEIFI